MRWRGYPVRDGHRVDALDGATLFCHPLAVEPQRLTVSLTLEPEILCSRDKPVFRATYACGTLIEASWAYPIDQSCLRMLGDELRATLR